MFLPVCKADLEARGWHYLDFICVTGDAYVDHPTFGIAIISRVLEDEGFKVGVLAQPQLSDPHAFEALGRPRYGFFVTSGNVDSMVSNYTVAKHRRARDDYSPGGKAGRRPDRAVCVYTARCKAAYPDVPVVIGGLEASLRRFAHYDYWDDRVHPSVLLESGADLLVYGMGERQTRAVARGLRTGGLRAGGKGLDSLRGVCFACPDERARAAENAAICPSFEEVKADKAAYARACRIQYDNQDAVRGRTVLQRHGEIWLCQNPPAPPLDGAELDRVHELPYERMFHPMYEKEGGVPAIEEVEFSITHNRGCFGACNFCSIAFHQGRRVTARSADSVVAEAERFTQNPRFKGYISDVGGATADFRLPSCQKQIAQGLCARKCLAPEPCPNLEASHRDYLALLRRLRALPGVKKVFIRSGLRFDYILADKDDTFFRELVQHHVSGQLRVAPEHCSPRVLEKMGKPRIESYLAFQKKFYALTKEAGKKQFLVPYLMSSHPGSTLADAVELALFLRREHLRPEQVQDFYPTPGTISTCMFYTGLDPLTMQPVYVPRSPHEKAMQRALLQAGLPQNRRLVLEALREAGREDLIGSGPDCLIPGNRSAAGSRGTPSGRDAAGSRGVSGKHSPPGRHGAAHVRGTTGGRGAAGGSAARGGKRTWKKGGR